VATGFPDVYDDYAMAAEQDESKVNLPELGVGQQHAAQQVIANLTQPCRHMACIPPRAPAPPDDDHDTNKKRNNCPGCRSSKPNGDSIADYRA
jgi:hypothetical protein